MVLKYIPVMAGVRRQLLLHSAVLGVAIFFQDGL